MVFPVQKARIHILLSRQMRRDGCIYSGLGVILSEVLPVVYRGPYTTFSNHFFKLLNRQGEQILKPKLYSVIFVIAVEKYCTVSAGNYYFVLRVLINICLVQINARKRLPIPVFTLALFT